MRETRTNHGAVIPKPTPNYRRFTFRPAPQSWHIGTLHHGTEGWTRVWVNGEEVQNGVDFLRQIFRGTPAPTWPPTTTGD